MELNRKLTKLLKGRTMQSESGHARSVTITFQDGSTLTFKGAAQATVATGAKGKAVHEAGERLRADLEGGPGVEVRLADPGSSVALRDPNGTVEYLEVLQRFGSSVKIPPPQKP